MQILNRYGYPRKHGLYDPAQEKDACGVGFVAHIQGQRSHQIVRDADLVLRNMDHRGACGCEANTGDGAGILTALPHEFLQKVAQEDLRAELPEPGEFAAGLVFLPQRAEEREQCKRAVEQIIDEQGQRLVGWRKVPTDAQGRASGTDGVAERTADRTAVRGGGSTAFGRGVRATVVHHSQASQPRVPRIRDAGTGQDVLHLQPLDEGDDLQGNVDVLAVAGLLSRPAGCRTYTTHLAMVHSRFSTNTFPSWDRAQPNRFMSHNGEINTLARQQELDACSRGCRAEFAVRRRDSASCSPSSNRIAPTAALSTTCWSFC